MSLQLASSDFMAEMVCSALVQETVSRGVSFALGRREEKASQGHLTERLEMEVSELEFALERAMELPIRHLSLLQRRKNIKRAYVEAMELLDKHKQQAMPPSQEELPQVVNKRKRWFNCAGLSTVDVGRFEWYADCAGRFVRHLESGCSLHHYTFCNPIVRHLLEGKTLTYYSEQGNLLRHLYIKPTYSDERGVEALLAYRYEDSTVAEKCFCLGLILRLTESTDLVEIAIKGLQLLASQFKLAVEYAMGELTLLSNLQDIAHLHGPLCEGIQEWHIKHTQISRPDPACCKGSRHGLCANNNVSSELADIFPEQIIDLGFQCYISAPQSKTRSSFHESGKSKNRGWKPPVVLTAAFTPHAVTGTQDSYALEIIGDATEYRNASSIQQVAETIQSGAVNCFSSTRPLDGDALRLGRARAPARGPAAELPPSFSPAATGCRRVVVVSDCSAKEEKGKGKIKEEEEGEPDLLRWLSSSLAPTATVASAADACAARERERRER
ncbi:uncharacterized protein [Miscanthus floridulus]|uniref:uncharacterized protein n=1 Tax=Miscanthus floridulus TaxID=154761 RepID=UPI00345AF451